VSPSTAPVTYYFQYGTGSSYGSTTGSKTLPPSSTSQAMHANVRGLIPGTVYHYRVVATTPSGTSYGRDETLTTPKAKMRRVRDHITLPRHLGALPLPPCTAGWSGPTA
jgi:phosphodiesterase/alkaline phosphatase D-like protein